MDLVYPQRLRPGDCRLGIIAPSSSAATVEDRVWRIGVERLRSLGFELRFGKYVKGSWGHSAGTVEERLEDLHMMLEDDEVNGIMTVFGGYSSNHLLQRIDYEAVRRQRKVFVGYSDITAMNMAMLSQAGLVNFSGPAFITFCQPELPSYTLRHFLRVLVEGGEDKVVASERWAEDAWFQKEELGPREWKRNPGWRVLREGVATGRAVGGNLGTMLLLAGTKYWPDMHGSVLFIEEDEVESPQTVDRCLTHLRHMGVFNKISGLVVGRFPSAVGLEGTEDLDIIIAKATEGHGFPIITGVDMSHTDPLMTIPIGGRCRLDTGAAEIRFEEAVR